MKQTTKNILGVAAIVLLSSGVAGLTTYKMLNKEKPAAFSELFQQNPNNLLPTVSKEEVKNIRLFLHRLGLTQLSGTYMHYSMERTLRCLCQIHRLGIRCMESRR